MTEQLPDRAQVVVIGGGIIGCSTAYHLAKLGCRDVVVLERSKISSGTTWHSAGMVRQLRSTVSLTQLAKYSVELYTSLEEETGQSTGWMNCGSISIAASEDRLHQIRHQASLARAFDIEVHEIDRAEIKKRWPFAHTDDIIAGIYSPTDGRLGPSDVCAALVRGARNNGARFFEDTPVTGFNVAKGRVTGVRTAEGDIECETVVLAAGMWSRHIAAMAGVSAPLYACEHFSLITKPFEGIRPGMPILGDHDGYMYIRDEGGGLMVGCFEPNAAPLDLEDLPADFSFDLLDENWEQFEPIMKGAIHRIPALETAEVRMLLNGPESFTLDGSFLLGEAPEVDGFFMCCGMNSVGVASGGGAGLALAEWIIEGEPTRDLWAIDCRRFSADRNNTRVIRARAAETLSRHYLLGYPGREYETGRGVRRTPFYDRLAERGAFFGERAGWERASWFQPTGRSVENKLTYARPAWFDCVEAECRATRDGVAVFDQSALGKLLIQGRDAETFLQRVCAANLAVAPGRVVYTPILNPRGGYDSDVVAMRLAEDVYMIATGSAQPTRDADILRRKIGGDEFVTVTDVTGAYGVLGVMGPKSRELLQRLSPDDFDNAAFPYFSHRRIEVGEAVVRAARVSYVGELGWELYVPTECAVSLYDDLWEAGRDLGLANAGTFALNSLRLEKGYCSWGHDIGPDDTPAEADLRSSERSQGVDRRRVLLSLDDPEVILHGHEPIVVDGTIVGQTSSADHGHTVGRAVAMGYVRLDGRNVEDMVAGGSFEIEVALKRHAATVSLRAFHDPDGTRLK